MVLGRLAIDRAWQGKRFGTALLVTRPTVLGVDVWADQIMRFEQASLK